MSVTIGELVSAILEAQPEVKTRGEIIDRLDAIAERLDIKTKVKLSEAQLRRALNKLVRLDLVLSGLDEPLQSVESPATTPDTCEEAP